MTCDIAKFPDENHKLDYVYGFLEGKAKDQIQPYVLAACVNLLNIATLLAILNRAFENPNQADIPTHSLLSLKQKADLSTYVAELSRLAADVPWNVQAKLD